jgi:hypothetical protein
VDFSQGGFVDQLGEGWFDREINEEGGYRWAARECSLFLFPQGREEFLQIRGVIPELEISKRPEVGLDVYQDGQLIHSQWFFKPQNVRMKIRVPLLGHQPHFFRFELSSSFCPARIGTGEDGRELGMIFSEIGLVAPEGGTGEEDDAPEIEV